MAFLPQNAPRWFSRLAREGRKAGLQFPNLGRARLGQEAIEWFRERAARVRGVNVQRFMAEAPESRFFVRLDDADIGTMLHFFYNPKWRDTLPYYDIFPLVFVVHDLGDRFHGLNMHYLPPVLRAQLMDALYTVQMQENNRLKRVNISYGILKNSARFEYFKPCYKEYLKTHLQSKFMLIRPEEWDMALFLPTARWKKDTQDNVWQTSRNIIRGHH